jgi:hypothetical protein
MPVATEVTDLARAGHLGAAAAYLASKWDGIVQSAELFAQLVVDSFPAWTQGTVKTWLDNVVYPGLEDDAARDFRIRAQSSRCRTRQRGVGTVHEGASERWAGCPSRS